MYLIALIDTIFPLVYNQRHEISTNQSIALSITVSYYDGTDEQNTSFQQSKHPVGNTPAYSSFSALSNPKRPLLPGIILRHHS